MTSTELRPAVFLKWHLFCVRNNGCEAGSGSRREAKGTRLQDEESRNRTGVRGETRGQVRLSLAAVWERLNSLESVLSNSPLRKVLF